MIIPYNRESINKVIKYFCEYRNTRDYHYLFSSKEWVSSFIEIYNPDINFLVLSKDKRNYYSLSSFNGRLAFTGDPFNDFNGLLVLDPADTFNLHDVFSYFAERNYTLFWQHLFESNIASQCKRSTTEGQISEGSTVGLKIDLGANPYSKRVSKTIEKMYARYSDDLTFHRVYGTDLSDNCELLELLFAYRRSKLVRRKLDEYNLSFESSFDLFIYRLSRFPSMSENIFIDYCQDRATNQFLALSLYFKKDDAVICYLRGHRASTNRVSYGLLLDYWSINLCESESISRIDLTRGDESYKYRLGAEEYFLDSFKTDDYI